MMKIAVVGTSNSILAKGYFPLYQAMEYPNQVDNFSLGASYCHYIPFALEKYALLENYDVLVTDCCPNDGSFFPYARTESWLYNELYSIFSLIKESSCKQLHLIFPTDLPFAIHENIHKQVCAELNIPFLDIGSILKQRNDNPEQALYADKMHVAPFYAKQIAWLIKQKRQKISTGNFSSPGYKHKTYFLYDLTKNANQSQNTLVARATSLRAENFVQLKNKQEICLQHLPPCNLESLYFYTNRESGYYHLRTEQNLKNYNLSCHLANIFQFRPIPGSIFAVNSFLCLQAGFNSECQELLEERNFPPQDKDSSELLINALLFSKEINPPLPWQAKKLPDADETDLKNYQKINSFLSSLAQYDNHMIPIPDEFILTGAALYPQHQTIRKRFAAILKKKQNPYYYFYFAKLYLLPRKKYSMAAKLLEHALSIKNTVLFCELLAVCYLEQNLFDKAYAFIQQNIPDKFPIIRLKLLISWAGRTKKKKEFICYAQKMLDYGVSINHLALLAKTALMFHEKELAGEFLNLITSDPRNFHHEEDKQLINTLMTSINPYAK